MRHRYPRYKRVTAAVTLLCLGLWVGYMLLWPNQGKAAPGAGIAVGAAAPDFELKTTDGTSIKLSDLKGKPVLLNFFATWCGPCRNEVPNLQAAYQEHQSDGLVVLAVNLNESNIAIQDFVSKYKLTFPIVVDKDDQVSNLYGIIPLPTSYFIDRQGIVQERWQGELSKERLATLLKKIQ